MLGGGLALDQRLAYGEYMGGSDRRFVASEIAMPLGGAESDLHEVDRKRQGAVGQSSRARRDGVTTAHSECSIAAWPRFTAGRTLEVAAAKRVGAVVRR